MLEQIDITVLFFEPVETIPGPEPHVVDSAKTAFKLLEVAFVRGEMGQLLAANEM